MANERKQLTEEQVRIQYANYEKRATWTTERIMKEVEKLYFEGIFSAFSLLGIILFLISKSGAAFAVCVLIGIAAGIAAGKLKVRKIKSGSGEMEKIERSEGYTQRFFDEVHKNSESGNYHQPTIIAMAYNWCGCPDLAIEELKKIDEKIYIQRPDNGDKYYAALLMAQLMRGDLDHAADAYSKGYYYLNTYKNNPIYGSWINLSLGMYEFYCGHYETSLQLLENAMRIHCADMKPENRIPSENTRSMICYWKAMNLASMGNKAAAWDSINYCKDFYKTPYYRQCCEKLLADMAENHKSEMIENAETLP